MSMKALYLYMITDTASGSAAAVQAANPILFPTISDVPDYTYKSLYDIFVGGSYATSELAKRIVYRQGMSEEVARGEITLLASEFESADLEEEGMTSNDPGATTLMIDIVFRLPESLADYEVMLNAELRLRYLIDETWRKRRRGVPPFIPNLGDKTVSGEVRCTWRRFPVPPRADELWTRYSLAYNIPVPRA